MSHRGDSAVGPAQRSQDHLIAPSIFGVSIMPLSTPHISAMVRYWPVCIRCTRACRSDSASPEPLGTAQPYGSVSNTSPAATSVPPLSLIANNVIGESADMASAFPDITAAVTSSSRSKSTFAIGGRPAAAQTALLAGISKVSCTEPANVETLRPQAALGSIGGAGRCAPTVPLLKKGTKAANAPR